MPACIELLALLAFFVPSPAAQTARVLLRAGDPVGPARLESLELRGAARASATLGQGSVLVVADTDAPPDSDQILLSLTREPASGNQTIAVLLREGDPEPGAPTSLLVGFPDGDLTAAGAGSLALVLSSGPFAATNLYWNELPIARALGRVAVSGLPSGGPTPLTYGLFRSVRGNGSRQVLTVADVFFFLVDTVPPFPVLVRYELDPAGRVTSASLALDAGADAGRSTPYRDLPHHPRATDMDEAGRWMTRALGTDGNWRVLRDGVELASEGAPSPVSGLAWASLGADQPVALDSLGGHAFVGTLAGDASRARVLVQDGLVLVRQGDVLPRLASATIEPHAARNLAYTADGAVLWIGELGGAGAGQALVRGREVLLASGDTLESQALVALEDFAVSSDGRFVFVDARLAGGPALLQLDLGVAQRLAPCASPNPCALRRTSGAVAIGATFRLELDGPVPPGSLGFLSFAAAGGSCAATFRFGEGTLAPGTKLACFLLGAHSGALLSFDLTVPDDTTLLGYEFFGQGGFLAAAGARPRVRLSNGLRFELGTP